MPITEDILNHQIIGPAYREGQQEGRQEGRREGRQEGRQEGELNILRRVITKRFGAIPEWLEEWLAHSSANELEELSDRVLDAQSLEDLVK